MHRLYHMNIAQMYNTTDFTNRTTKKQSSNLVKIWKTITPSNGKLYKTIILGVLVVYVCCTGIFVISKIGFIQIFFLT